MDAVQHRAAPTRTFREQRRYLEISGAGIESESSMILMGEGMYGYEILFFFSLFSRRRVVGASPSLIAFVCS